MPLDWALLEGSRKIILDDVTHTTHEAGTTSLQINGMEQTKCWIVGCSMLWKRLGSM